MVFKDSIKEGDAVLIQDAYGDVYESKVTKTYGEYVKIRYFFLGFIPVRKIVRTYDLLAHKPKERIE